MNITIDKAADVVTNANVLKRVFMNPKEKRYCAKCKTELSWYYAENANYIFFCKNCETKIIVTARSLLTAAEKVGVKK
jgi:DNA-directed RNA polymerase subunit RPC12/RpoP